MENKLLQAIKSIMSEIKVSKSDIDAKGVGNYKAFTTDKVLEETKKLLPKNNVCTFTQNDIIETQYITKKTQNGERTTHNVIVKTSVIFVHTETGEQFISYAVGEASDGGDKALSKAQTDGFKKVLCQVFHLFDDDGDKDNLPSDDNKITKTTKQTPKEPAKQTVQQPAVQSDINDFTNKINSAQTLADINALAKELFDNKNLTDNERNARNKLIWGKKQTFKINEKDLKIIQGLISDAELNSVNICNKYKIQALTELNYKQWFEVKKECEKAINDMN